MSFVTLVAVSLKVGLQLPFSLHLAQMFRTSDNECVQLNEILVYQLTLLSDIGGSNVRRLELVVGLPRN